jgi:hypothetical protein
MQHFRGLKGKRARDLELGVQGKQASVNTKPTTNCDR